MLGFRFNRPWIPFSALAPIKKLQTAHGSCCSPPNPHRAAPAALQTMPKLDPDYDQIPEGEDDDEDDDDDHPSLTAAERNPSLK